MMSVEIPDWLVAKCDALHADVRRALPGMSFVLAIDKGGGTTKMWWQDGGLESSGQIIAHLAGVLLVVPSPTGAEDYKQTTVVGECRICGNRGISVCEGRTHDLECAVCHNMTVDPMEESESG